jgi:integrase
LLDSIDVTTPVGLRDRALIGLMVYSFARIGAALGMRVEDVYTQNRRLWVRLREKGGKAHTMPCHHNLEDYLIAYLDGTNLRDDPRGPLFRTIGRGSDRKARRRGRDRDQAWQSQLPGDRYHRLPEERRHA